MTIAVAQTLDVDQTFSGSFASNCNVGDTILLCLTGFTTSGGTITFTSPLYNGSPVTGASEPVIVQSPSSNGVVSAFWVLPNVQSAGKSVSVTETGGGMATVDGLHALNITGLGPSPVVDVSNSKNAASGKADSGSITPAKAPALVVGINIAFAEALTGAGAPWTELTHPSNFAFTGYQVITSTGASYEYSLTTASGSAAVCGAIISLTPSAPAEIDGGASGTSSGTGKLTETPAVMSATGASASAGTGSAVLDPAAMSAAGSSGSAGTGSMTLAPAAIAGTGSTFSAATGSMTLTESAGASASGTSAGGGSLSSAESAGGSASGTSGAQGSFTAAESIGAAGGATSAGQGAFAAAVSIAGSGTGTSSGQGSASVSEGSQPAADLTGIAAGAPYVEWSAAGPYINWSAGQPYAGWSIGAPYA